MAKLRHLNHDFNLKQYTYIFNIVQKEKCLPTILAFLKEEACNVQRGFAWSGPYGGYE